jgi:hypothetical protein
MLSEPIINFQPLWLGCRAACPKPKLYDGIKNNKPIATLHKILIHKQFWLSIKGGGHTLLLMLYE